MLKDKTNKLELILLILVMIGFFGFLLIGPQCVFASDILSVSINQKYMFINGSAFGVHADNNANKEYMCAIWIDTEDGIFKKDGLDTIQGCESKWQLISSNQPLHSSYSFRRINGDASNDNICGLITGAEEVVDNTFLSYKLKVPSNNVNGKTVRLGNIQGQDYWYNYTSRAVASDRPTQWVDYGALPTSRPLDVWVYIKQEQQGGTKPAFQKIYINSNVPQYSATHSVPDPMKRIRIGSGLDVGDPSSYYWEFDDFYFDYTLARVELCNSSTWNLSTKCEVQPPTAWSDTSITALIHYGEFSVGDQAYLYVIDENGEVNENGYPITIGETQSDTTPPTLTDPTPTGTLPTGTTSTNISITTNETSTCRYSTTPNTDYNSMTDNMTSNGNTHTATINNLTNGNTYNYYIRCQDTNNNTNTTDTTITFSINNQTYNLSNFISILNNWLGIGDNTSDLNNDGIVNTRDLGIVMSNWN